MVDFGVRLRAYLPGSDEAIEMPRPILAEAAFPHDDVGALQVTYSRAVLGGDLLSRALSDGLELAVEVTDHAGQWVEPDGARFLWIARKDDLADTKQVVEITAPSWGWLAGQEALLDLTNLLPEDADEAGKRPFLSATAGEILATLHAEHVARGNPVPLTLGFDTGQDSAAAAWANVVTLYYEPGISTAAVLENLTAQGMCDWRTRGRQLLAWNADTACAPDLTIAASPVALALGRELAEAPSDQSIEELVSRVLLRGDAGLVLQLDNPEAPTPFGAWEGYIEQGGVSDEGTATALVQAELTRRARTRQQFTRSLTIPGSTFWPMVDYTPGAWIFAPTTTAQERVRVQQVTLTWGEDSVGGSVVLHDRVLDAELRRSKRVAGIVGGATSGGAGGSRPTTPGEGQDKRTPSAPLGLVVDSDAYIGPDGLAHGLLTAAWAAVATATDGTALDVVGYDVAVREPAGTWAVVESVDGPSWTGSPFPPGDELEVRVRARGQYTTKPGVWSAVVPVTVAADVTPPAVPSVPSVSSRVGVITVSWDGLSDVGTAMAADFSHVEVAMSASIAPGAVIGSLPLEGAVLVQDQPYNEDRYFHLRSVDTSGNASAWSGVSAPIAATSVAEADIDAAVNEAISQALTGPVDGARIEPWTVPGDRVLIGDVDSRVPWNPKAGLVPHEAANAASVASYEHPSLSWCYQITGGSQADGTLASALTLLADVTPGATRFPVEPGRSYRLSLLLTVSGTFPVARQVRASMNWYDATGAFLGQGGTPAVQGGTGTNVITTSTVLTAPDGARYATPQVQKNFWSDGTLYVHKVGLTLAADAELVVDGSITALKLAADSVTANSVAAGAVDGMVITGSEIQTAESGARIYLSGTSGFPGIWLYDSASPNWRVSLQVSASNVPGLWLRDSAGTELMRVLAIDGGYLRSSYPSGRTATYLSQGQLFVYSDEDASAFPDIMRTYWLDASGQKHFYVGHESSPVDVLNMWGDNVAIRSTSGTGGAVTLSSRGTSGVQLLSYDVSGSVIRGFADFSTTRMWLGQYGPGGGLGSRLNLVDGQAVLSAGDATGSAFVSAGPSSGVVQLSFGTGTSSSRRIEFVGGTDLIAAIDYGSLYLYKNASVTAGDSVVRRSSDGRIGWNSSSRRFKQDIEDHVIDLAAMRALRPRSWRARDEVADTPDTTNRYVGLVAEEVHDTGLVEAVSYEADGTPRNINDRAFIVGLIAWAKEHDARLAALEGAPAPLATRMSTTALAAATATGDVVAIPPPGPAVPPTPTLAPAEHRPDVPPDHASEVAQLRRASTASPKTPAPAPVPGDPAPHTKETPDE